MAGVKDTPPELAESQLELVEQSFAAMAPRGEALVERFYEELFARHPEAASLFAHTDMEAQKKHLLDALVLVVKNLRRPEKLLPALQSLGARHQQYGVRSAHYGMVSAALLNAMREFAGAQWTPEVGAAWSAALEGVARIMLDAYTDKEEIAMAPLPVETETQKVNGFDSRLFQVLPVPAFAADGRSRVLTWNAAMEELTGKPAAQMIGQKAWSAFFERKRPNPVDAALLSEEAEEQSLEILHARTQEKQKMNFKAVPAFDGEGEVVGVSVVLETEGAASEASDEAQAEAARAASLSSMIEGASAYFMMCDREFRITYLNPALKEMLRQYQSDLRTLFPGFDADKLIGVCIDDFHQNPAHQHRLLEQVDNLPYKAEIKVGGLEFGLNLTALRDAEGNHIGNAVEWTDYNARALYRDEMNRLLEEARAGHLEYRGSLEKLDEVYRPMMQGINEMLDAILLPIGEGNRILGQIGEGEIDELVEAQYQGDHEKMKQAVNSVGSAIQGLNAELQRLIEAARAGRLDERGAPEQFKGAYAGIVQGVNEMLDAIISPLKISADYVDRIAGGDIPEPITEEYQGDFNQIKNNLNRCIEALRGLIEEDGGVALQAAAEKDLTRRVEGRYEGMYDQMKENVNAVLENLDTALTQVAEASEQVASASGQINSGSQTLAQGASEQASSLEEIASSLQELTSMAKQNASNSQEARALTEGSRTTTQRGVQSMNRLSGAIDKIKASSDETSKIIKTIDEIAFQTNLLALNAAVEAARAGEAGKGFAVVAEEVRNLAMRSAEAAKNTADLIEGSAKNAEEGVALNQEVLSNLSEINEQINKVGEVIAEILAGSEQQSEGIGQINAGVDQLNQVTQQNAANAEESASAAEELSSQAESMSQLVGGFQLTSAGGPARPPARSRRPAAPPRASGPAGRRVGQGGNGDRRRATPAPEEVIPLDDEDVETLKEF